jgi:hypothetical protein
MNVTQIVELVRQRQTGEFKLPGWHSAGKRENSAGAIADDLRISYSAAKYWLDKATNQGKLERKCFKPCHCFQRHYYVIKEQEVKS